MILVLNHKSNLDRKQIEKYIAEYRKIDKKNHQIIICPSSCYLPLFEQVELGSQDISRYPQGAYTGEVSGKALKSLNVSYVLINHSERVNLLNESLEIAKQKIERALENNLIPIICVGDTKEEHEQGIHLKRIKEILEQLITKEMKEYIIAYEPLYAIGSGLVPSNEDIEEVITMIKSVYPTKVLYGGSVDEKNIETLKEINQLDGFLLGGISLRLTNLQILLQKMDKNVV